MKKIILLCSIFILFQSQISYAQHYNDIDSSFIENGYLKGFVIIKFLPQHNGNFSDSQLQNVFDYLNVNEVYKKFPNSPAPDRRLNDIGLKMVDITLIYELRYDSDVPMQKAIAALRRTNLFEYVEPHYVQELMYTPNDPKITSQYMLDNIFAYDAWDFCKGDTNFVVAIVDTGIEFAHPDLYPAIKYNYEDPIDGIDNDNDGYIDNYRGWDMGSFDNDPQYDVTGHGIHVSGIACAEADNTFGIAGSGFNCRLLPVKTENQYGVMLANYEGVVYAADHGAHIINCSWGTTAYPGQYGQDIVSYASINCNALVVASCGNANNQILYYPASYTHALSIAATNNLDRKWSNSTYNYAVDICAPGEAVFSTWAGASFTSSSGTSMAAPCVSGAAALIASHYPTLNRLQIAEIIRNTTDYIYNEGTNSYYTDKLGTGRLNMYYALTDTLKPGVRLLSYSVSDNNNNVFSPGDTLDIRTNIYNFLRKTDSLEVKLECLSPYINTITNRWLIGEMNSLSEKNNQYNPFKVVIDSTTPPSTKLEFLITFTDHNYKSKDYFTFSINTNYINLDTNKITATITSNSIIGYNNLYTYSQGSGISFDGSSSVVSASGFMFGTASNKVSDNLTSSVASNLDADFTAEIFPWKISNPSLGDECVISIFNDNNVDSLYTNHIKVEQYSYAWNSPERDNFIIIQHNIENIGTDSITNAFAAFFADWDINAANSNRCFFDSATNSLVACSVDSSFFIALKPLCENNHFYAGDYDGFNSSIAISDGFTGLEKFNLMNSDRSKSGTEIAGNDIYANISTGPFNIAPNDTAVLLFAMIAGTSFADISNASEVINSIYYKEDDDTTSVASYKKADFQIYPNPANTNFQIISDESQIVDFTIRNMQGEIVLNKNNHNCGDNINTSKLTQGLYFVSIKTDEIEKTLKLLIVK